MPHPDRDENAYHLVAKTFDEVIQPGILNQCDVITSRLITDGRLVFDDATNQVGFAQDLKENLKKLIAAIRRETLVTQFAADTTQIPLELILNHANAVYSNLGERITRLLNNGSQVDVRPNSGRTRYPESLIDSNVITFHVQSEAVLSGLMIDIVLSLTLYSFFNVANRKSLSNKITDQIDSKVKELNRLLNVLKYTEPQVVEVIIDRPYIPAVSDYLPSTQPAELGQGLLARVRARLSR